MIGERKADKKHMVIMPISGSGVPLLLK